MKNKGIWASLWPMRIEPPLEISDSRRKRGPKLLFYLCIILLGLLSYLLWTDRPVKPPHQFYQAPPDPTFHSNLESVSVYKTPRSQAVLKEQDFFYGLPDPECVAGLTVLFRKKTDISRFKLLKIRIHALKNQALPENLRVELKSYGRILRAIPVKLSAAPSQNLELPIHFQSGIILEEITLSISYAKAGESKSGGFRLVDLSFAS